MINFDVHASDLQAAMNMLKSAGAHYYTKPNTGTYNITDVEKGIRSNEHDRAYAPTSDYREQTAQQNAKRSAVILTGRLYLGGDYAGMYDYAYINGNTTLGTEEYPKPHHWFTNNTDTHWALVCVDGNLTTGNRIVIRPPTRKLGFVLHVDGDMAHDGLISMTGRGANHSGTGNSHGYTAPLTIPVKSGINIPATGGAGGARKVQTSAGSSLKNDGGTATNGTGGGGSGNCHPVVSGTQLTSGAGAAGSCFSSGSGGGSAMLYNYGTNGADQSGETMDAISYGGAGGNAVSVSHVYGQMGGSGNPAGCIMGSDATTDLNYWGGQGANTNPTDWHYYGYGEDVNIEDKRATIGNSYYLSRPYSAGIGGIDNGFDGTAGCLYIFVNGTWSGTGKAYAQGSSTGNAHDGVSGAGGGCVGGGVVCILSNSTSGGPSSVVTGGPVGNNYGGGGGGNGSAIRGTF